MTTAIQYRLCTDAEVGGVARLATQVFDECVAPLYSQKGREEFHRIAAVEAFQERNRTDHVTLIAEQEGEIIGMLHLRWGCHVAMLFVERAHQRCVTGWLASRLRGCS